jgi:hypothetical protein
MQRIYADPVVIMELKPYPEIANTVDCQNLSRDLKNPGAIAQHCISGILDQRIVMGILATYQGYLNLSDQYGMITFPYMHPKPKIDLLITNRIVPILMAGNTVHHWEIEEGTPAEMYSITRRQDENTKLFYWDTKKVEVPTSTRVIDINTIILLEKPENIFEPTGISVTQESPHLVLPILYVKNNQSLVSQALYMLDLRSFFGRVKNLYKKEPQRYSRQIDIL